MTTIQIDTPRAFLPLLKPARYKGAYGGRGSAKSHFFAEMLVEKAVMQPGLRWACLREIQKSLRLSVKQLLEDKIDSLGVGHLFESKRDEIVTPGNGLIIFQGMQDHTADSIKSLEGFDGALFEEAQSASQRSLDLLRPTIRKDGSELWFPWNPDLATDPIDVLLRGPTPPPDSVVIEVNHTDNPWFPKVLQEEMEYDKRRDPDKYAHVWLGKYRQNSSARVFKKWRIEEFEPGPDWVRRQGADWGFAVDPSVLISCYLVGRTLYVDHEAYMVGCEIVDLPELFDRIPDSRKWFTTADSARPETVSHMRKHWSEKINSAIKGAKSLEEGVEWLQSFDIVVHPRCKHLIDELSLYSYKVDDKTQVVLPILQDKDNHVIDALRYACEGVRRATKPKKDEKPKARVIATPGGWMR